MLLAMAGAVANLINIAWFSGGNARVGAQISIIASLGAFATTVVMFFFLRSSEAATLPQVSFEWLNIGNQTPKLSVNIGLRLDYLSLIMALVVTGVGSMIHIYSAGYMKGDRAYCRYFSCLSLFM